MKPVWIYSKITWAAIVKLKRKHIKSKTTAVSALTTVFSNSVLVGSSGKARTWPLYGFASAPLVSISGVLNVTCGCQVERYSSFKHVTLFMPRCLVLLELAAAKWTDSGIVLQTWTPLKWSEKLCEGNFKLQTNYVNGKKTILDFVRVLLLGKMVKIQRVFGKCCFSAFYKIIKKTKNSKVLRF